MIQSSTSISKILEEIRAHLDLSSQTEQDLLEEIECHLEDALAEARLNGEDETAALIRVAREFDPKITGTALQDIHAPWESADAIIACALPVIATLVLRWLVFAPDGSAIAWQSLLERPAFWVVAVAVLLVPALKFHRWSYALASWVFFWFVTIIFMTLPNIQQW